MHVAEPKLASRDDCTSAVNCGQVATWFCHPTWPSRVTYRGCSWRHIVLQSSGYICFTAYKSYSKYSPGRHLWSRYILHEVGCHLPAAYDGSEESCRAGCFCASLSRFLRDVFPFLFVLVFKKTLAAAALCFRQQVKAGAFVFQKVCRTYKNWDV